MIPCPEPGIHHNVPEDQYHLWDAVNASLLKTVARKGPLQARYAQLHQNEPTPAMVFGTRGHAFVLEQHRVAELYTKPLNLPRRKKVDKEAHAKYEALHAGKEFLKEDQYATFLEMSRMMHSQQTFAELWRNRLGGDNGVEICIVWIDEDTGLRCKCRIDLLTKFQGLTCVVDYKTCPDASQWHFAKDMWSFRYDIQAAHYLASADAIAPGHHRAFLLAAQEKTPPFDRQIHSLGPQSLESGQIAWRRALDTWAACVEADDFPGLPEGICETEMPSYAINLID